MMGELEAKPAHSGPAGWQRYTVALLTVALASAFSWVFREYTERTVLIFYFAAVIGTAWYGGFGPGALVTILSLIAADYLFMPPRFTLTLLSSSEVLPLILFLIIALMTSVLSGQSKDARAHAEKSAEEARALASQLEEQATELESQTVELEQQFEESRRLADELEVANRELQQRSRELLSEAERIGQIGSWEWDLPTNRVAWSEQLYRLYGLDPFAEPVSYERFLELVHPDDRDAAHNSVQQALQSQRPFEFQHRIVGKDGKVRTLYARGRVDAGPDGKPQRMIGTGQDISGQVEAQKITLQLQREEARRTEAEAARRQLEVVLESITDAFVSIDRNWRYTYLNRAALELEGVPASERVGRVVWDVHPGMVGTDWYQLLHQAVETQQPVEGERYFELGNRWLQIRAFPSPEGLAIYYRDVTDTRRSRELQGRLAAIVESSRDSIISADLTGKILSWNRGATELYGYTESEAIGQNLDLIVPEQHRAAVRDVFERARRGESIELQEAVRRTKSGRRITVSVSVSPLRSDDTVVAVSKIDRDITLQKRAEEWQSLLMEATRRLSATLDQNQAISALVDLLVPAVGSMSVVYLAEGETLEPSFFLHEDRELEGTVRELLQNFPVNDNGPIGRVWRSGRAELSAEWTDQERQNIVQDERQLELSRRLATRSFVIVPLPVRGSVLGVLSLSTSNPDEQYDERDLAALEELGRRTGIAIDNARAYQAEHAARREAETANQAKLEFLTRMSHELRTPLNAIAGYAQLLEVGIGGGMTTKQVQHVQRIQRNQQHLLGLINDVLNFAKLETGHVHFSITSFPVMDLLEDVETLIAPQIHAKHLRFECKTTSRDLRVTADPDRLQQVVLNLLSNAVKFTEAGGRVTVETEPVGEQVMIRVIDTGDGIPEDKLQAIFDPFVQVDMSYTRAKEGTGLGLSISRDLARGMGGDITVESTIGEGSTFTILLPRAG